MLGSNAPDNVEPGYLTCMPLGSAAQILNFILCKNHGRIGCFSEVAVYHQHLPL